MVESLAVESVMRVYRVSGDVEHYQSLLPEDEGVWSTELLTFNGMPKQAEWSPPAVYVPEPLLLRGEFFEIAGTFAADRRAVELAEDLLEMSGELLPLPYKAETLQVVNVTHCFDVLDEDRTEWSTVSGRRVEIRRYAFHPHRLPEVPLFVIPETRSGEILTVEGLKDPADEFKGRVERAKLTGLEFDLLWSGD